MAKKGKPECIYVASRLTAKHPIDYLKNLEESIEAGIEVWKKGHYPYVPGWDFMMIMRVKGDIDLDHIYNTSLEWMCRCDSILVLNGYHDVPKSMGVIEEVKEAIARGMKFYWSLDEIPEVTK